MTVSMLYDFLLKGVFEQTDYNTNYFQRCTCF